MREFDGKWVLITGANRGIGRGIADLFAREGANLITLCRQPSAESDGYFSSLEHSNSIKIKRYYADLSDYESLNTTLKSVVNENKVIDVLINNAGVAFGAAFLMTPVKKLKEIFEINYFSQIMIMQMIVKSMLKNKSGVILNMASVGGIETNPGYLAYGSSKAALIYATQCLSKEVGIYGIRVNAIAPGLIETQMGNYKSEEEKEKVVQRTSMRRTGDVDDIAQMVLYLSSDKAKYITGQVIRVDGGR